MPAIAGHWPFATACCHGLRLSRTTPLAVSLIASHPAHYAGTFAKAAAWFWKGVGRGSMPWRTASGPLSLAWLGQKLLLFIASGMLFLLTAILTALCLLRRDRPGTRVR